MNRALVTLAAVVGLGVLGGLAGLGGVAHAESKADKAFAKGKKLLAAKKYQEACQAFEESDQLETGIGTKLNVARCYEEWGKLATALRWYQDAEVMAKDKSDARVTKIKELEENIDADVPRLTIKAGEGVDTSVLTLDGAPTKVNEALTVDPGPHELLWTNPDGKKKSKVVPLEKGGSSEVKVDLPKGSGKHKKGWGKAKPSDKPKQPRPEEIVETPEEPVTPVGDGKNQRLAGIVTGAAGVVMIGVASVLTLSARSKYNDALSAHCNGDRTMCDDEGLSTTSDARHTANISTVVALVGVAAVGTGVVLYLIAPHGTTKEKKEKEARLYLAPDVGPDGAAILLGGKF